MIVKTVETSFKNAPDELLNHGWSKSTKTSLILGKQYRVYAISIWEDIPHFQIIEKNEYDVWYPSFLFEIVDRTIPPDWECNIFNNKNGCLRLIVGPCFIAESQESYQGMVEKWPEQRKNFWKRVTRDADYKYRQLHDMEDIIMSEFRILTLRSPKKGILIYFSGNIKFVKSDAIYYSELRERELNSQDLGMEIDFDDYFSLKKGSSIEIQFGDYSYNYKNTKFPHEGIQLTKSETYDSRFIR